MTDLRTRTITQLAECLFLSGNTVKSLGDKGIAMIAANQFANGERLDPEELKSRMLLTEAAHRAFVEAQNMGEGK